MPRLALAGLLIWLATAQVHAAQVLSVQASRDGEHFTIGMHIVLDAPAPGVFRALRDYPAMMRYDPDLRAVRVEPMAATDRVRLFTTIHACVLFFCKTMRQEQIMAALPSGHGGVLRASLLPQDGAFSGHIDWSVESCSVAASPSCMDVRIELVPQFWVPPMIGPWLIRRKMYQEARDISAGLEQAARAAAPREALGTARNDGH